MEALRLLAVVPPGEPVQRKPPSNRGVCHLRSAAGPGRSAGGVPLRGGSSCDRIALRIRRGRVARGVRRTTGQTAGRADVHSLARGVEIRRAGVPLLPARPRSRDSGRVGRRRAHRVARRPAAGVVTPRDRGGDRHRSRGGFHRGRTRRARLHHGDSRRGVGRLPPAHRETARRRHPMWPVVGPRESAERAPHRVVLHRRGRTGHRRSGAVECAYSLCGRSRSTYPAHIVRSMRVRYCCSVGARSPSTAARRSTARHFVDMLSRVLPGARTPWNSVWWTPRVHLAIFVHRVDAVARRGCTC